MPSLRVLLLLLLHFVCSNTALSADGMPVVVEFEPNDLPQQALSFSAPVTLSGSMNANDQDAFLWRISDADALQRWNLTLYGIPEVLTGVSIVRIDYGPDPHAPNSAAKEVVIGTKTLLTFGIRDGSRPVTRRNIFFPPGDYVVGFFQTRTSAGFKPPSPGSALAESMSTSAAGQANSAANAYRLVIEPGLKAAFPTPKSHSTRDTAAILRPGRSYSAITSDASWYVVDVSDAQAEKLWTLQGEVMLENVLTARLSMPRAQNSVQQSRIGQAILSCRTLLCLPGVTSCNSMRPATLPAPGVSGCQKVALWLRVGSESPMMPGVGQM